MSHPDIESTKAPFHACTCGSEDPEHEEVTVTLSATGSIRVVRHSHWWGGAREHGLWWRTYGSVGARYYSELSPALGFALKLAQDGQWKIHVSPGVQKLYGRGQAAA